MHVFVFLCVRVCICACACLHVSVHNIMCSAGPEVAVLDWLALKQIQYIGKGGGGVVVAGLQVACEAHIQVLGHPPEKHWEFSPSYTDYIPVTSDFLCSYRLPLPGHSYILSPFHPYIAFMPLQFLMCISIITVYKVHYCIIIKHAKTLYNSTE